MPLLLLTFDLRLAFSINCIKTVIASSQKPLNNAATPNVAPLTPNIYNKVNKNREKENIDWRTYDEAEREVAGYYDKYVREKHPCKDPSGQPLWDYKQPLYELHVNNVPMPGGARPLTVNLLELLEETFADSQGNERNEPDTSQ